MTDRDSRRAFLTIATIAGASGALAAVREGMALAGPGAP
jgi:hypothetical protein